MRKNGFTLIELIIVIAVIAILIGIALPRFRGMQDEGNIAKAKGELRTLQIAVESYYIHNNNAYPAALSNLILAATRPKIITTLPTDPFNAANNYGYTRSPDNKYYLIYSVGVGGSGVCSTMSIDNNGTVTEGDVSCIYASNAGQDTVP